MSEETAEYKKGEVQKDRILKEVYELTGEFAPAQVNEEGFTEISVLNFMLILGNIVNKKGIFKSQPLEID